MKKNAKRVSHAEPSKASLLEMPEADFSKPGWHRNPARAERIRKDGGYTVAVDGQKPYFVRVGAGRPKRGEKAAPSAARTVRLPVALWKALKARAEKDGSTLNAEIGAAAAEWVREVRTTPWRELQARKTARSR